MAVRDKLLQVAALGLALSGCSETQEAAANSIHDANPERRVVDAALDSDADAVSEWVCDGAPGDVKLGPPEVVASGRSGLVEGIGTSPAGPVWAEWGGTVWLGSDPPSMLFPGGPGPLCAFFRATSGWFEIACGQLQSMGSITVGNVVTGSVYTCGSGAGCDDGGSFSEGRDEVVDIALDGSNIYILGFKSSTESATSAPLISMWQETRLLDLGHTRAAGIAVDETRVYALVIQEAEYAIRAVPKGGGPAVTLASGVDPEVWNDFPATVLAQNGTLAWAYWGGGPWPPQTRFAEILRSGSNAARTLVDDPDGIACGRNQARPAIAMDAEYLYWATVTGSVKRVRLCGGIPEVIAENQANPVAIAVDDIAVYWLDYGSTSPFLDYEGHVTDGKVMRMRKLDAPGYAEAGTDAGITDASVGDGDATD